MRSDAESRRTVTLHGKEEIGAYFQGLMVLSEPSADELPVIGRCDGEFNVDTKLNTSWCVDVGQSFETNRCEDYHPKWTSPLWWSGGRPDWDHGDWDVHDRLEHLLASFNSISGQRCGRRFFLALRARSRPNGLVLRAEAGPVNRTLGRTGGFREWCHALAKERWRRASVLEMAFVGDAYAPESSVCRAWRLSGDIWRNENQHLYCRARDRLANNLQIELF